VDHDTPIAWTLDLDAHGTECRQCGKRILAFQEAVHVRSTLRQGAQHDGAVGNGFVARNPGFARQDSTGL
jgi:hypothetical protein